MPVALKPVTRDDLSPLFNLKVTPEQCGFVAPNEYSLAQVHYETGATPYVIWADDVRVGFCQVIDMRSHKYREPSDDAQAMYLWRLMIGADHQGKGYGAQTLNLLIAMAKDAGHPCIEVTCVPENAGALRLYEGLGFVRTGVMIDGEMQLRLTL